MVGLCGTKKMFGGRRKSSQGLFLLEIVFRPEGNSGFGFVNAVEVFTAPADFVVDYGARLVGPSGVVEYKNLSSQVLETVHRINVGGVKVTPFNDTLWRTWIVTSKSPLI